MSSEDGSGVKYMHAYVGSPSAVGILFLTFGMPAELFMAFVLKNEFPSSALKKQKVWCIAK